MNANELAQSIATCEPNLGRIATDCADMLRQQADRIKELEQAIKDADEWLESGEGVSLCYYSFSDSNPKSIKIIKEITG
jgi:hypothetical protein